MCIVVYPRSGTFSSCSRTFVGIISICPITDRLQYMTRKVVDCSRSEIYVYTVLDWCWADWKSAKIGYNIFSKFVPKYEKKSLKEYNILFHVCINIFETL